MSTNPTCGVGCTQQQGRLIELADEYRDVLSARARCAQHVHDTHAHLRVLIGHAGCTEPGQLTESVIQRAVGKILAKGRSLRTCNSYLISAKSFCRWLVRNGHLTADPAAEIPKYDEAADRRHRRTSFSDAQLTLLLNVTAASKRTYQGIDGRSRAELYHASACTGLREGTLAMLTAEQFELGGAVAVVRVRAEQIKDREDLVVPIQMDSASRLAGWLADKMPGAKAFRLPAKWNVIRMLRGDLREAGIPYCQVITTGTTKRRANVLDFHALRHTFCTRGAMAGVPLGVMQQWMGHSDPKLTANLYSHILLPDTVAALAKLRKIG